MIQLTRHTLTKLGGLLRGYPKAVRTVMTVEGQLHPSEARLLYRLAQQVQTQHCIIEVGSYRGRSTVALSLGSRKGAKAPVFAVEPHEPFTGILGGQFGPNDRAAFYRTMLRTGCYDNVRLINLSSEVVAQGWKTPIGLLWIDGDHSYEGAKRDLRVWEPHLAPEAFVAFHDSRDPDLGPAQVIAEALDSGHYTHYEQVGLTTVLRRR